MRDFGPVLTDENFSGAQQLIKPIVRIVALIMALIMAW